MDWRNEPYVRWYTRDTTNWKRLGWDGQSVLGALMRKVDRAGTLDLGGLEPWEAVSLHTGAPEDVAKRGVEALIRVGTMVVRERDLVLPNFIEAQECIRSDKARTKLARERRAAGLPARHSQNDESMSRSVTSESRGVTPESREPDSRHDESRAVTPRHAKPALHCSALPCNADHCSALPPLLGVAGEGPADPSALAQSVQSHPDNDYRPPPVPEPSKIQLGSAHLQTLRDAIAGEAMALGFSRTPTATNAQYRDAVEACREISERRSIGFAEACAVLARAALTKHRDTSRQFGFVLAEVDPFPPQPDEFEGVTEIGKNAILEARAKRASGKDW